MVSGSAKSLKATDVECHTNVMMFGEGSVRATTELADYSVTPPHGASGREGHHLPLEQRWADPPPLAADAHFSLREIDLVSWVGNRG